MPVTCAMESGPSAAITSAKRSPELRFHDDPVPAVLGHDVVDRDGSPWLTVAAAQASIKRRPGAHG
jgi:hypothetical protein